MDEFNFTLNIFYTTAFDSERHADFNHVWAVVRPTDQKWSFANQLSDIIDIKSKRRLSSQDIEWCNLTTAGFILRHAINPTQR